MTTRTALSLFAVALLMLLAVANFVLFPRVEIVKNTTTVTHTNDTPTKSKPQPLYGPPLGGPSHKRPGGGAGGGVIIIGG